MTLPHQSLAAWLSYIETLHPHVIALGLERVQTVGKRLDVLAPSCPVITVAGTNGKGSCVTFAQAILTAAGYRVGTYTSPHLLRFQERACCDGVEFPEEEWVAAFTRVERARGDTLLTYFEFTTLAALLLLQQARVDVLVLEIGLGGRLDAVNSVAPDVAVITTIAMDHMEWLGHTRNAIATEKAGIMRATKPVVIGDTDPPANLLAHAAQINAPAYCLNRDFHIKQADTRWDWLSATTSYYHLPLPHLPLQNAATALMALECLRCQLPITPAHIAQGIASAYLPGRFQYIKPCILDVAHNPAAAELLALRLRQHPISGHNLAVVSVLADKDIAGTLHPLLADIDTWYVAGLPVTRGATAEILAKHLQELGVVAYHKAPTVATALRAAISACTDQDRVVVFGSFHTVAAALLTLEQALIRN